MNNSARNIFATRWNGIAVQLVVAWLCIGWLHAEERTALDRYIAAPDPSYSYKLVNTMKGDGQTTFVLEMTSQLAP